MWKEVKTREPFGKEEAAIERAIDAQDTPVLVKVSEEEVSLEEGQASQGSLVPLSSASVLLLP